MQGFGCLAFSSVISGIWRDLQVHLKFLPGLPAPTILQRSCIIVPSEIRSSPSRNWKTVRDPLSFRRKIASIFENDDTRSMPLQSACSMLGPKRSINVERSTSQDKFESTRIVPTLVVHGNKLHMIRIVANDTGRESRSRIESRRVVIVPILALRIDSQIPEW